MEISALLVVGISILILLTAYMTYGFWLSRTWGISESRITPACRLEDGKDYSPASSFTAFAHQFSSIAGAGPITGPIIASMYGWVPALAWLLIGGIFFGAVHDFAAMYVSVREDGRSLGMIAERYIGRQGKRMFLVFCWMFMLISIAAFADIICSTLSAAGRDGAMNTASAAASSTSILYVFAAIGFGCFTRKVRPGEMTKFAAGVLLVMLMVAAGIKFPLFLSLNEWYIVVFAYCLIASVMPMWMLMQPRDYLSSFLLIAMMVGGVFSLMLADPLVEAPAFADFTANGQPIFPMLFITIACGAISGFHSLVSTGTTSKTIAAEPDMLPVGYGAMLLETLLAIIALFVACCAPRGSEMLKGTPFQIFSAGVGNLLVTFGVPHGVSMCLMTLCVSAFAMTSIDAAARIGRMSFQEFFSLPQGQTPGAFRRFITGDIVSTLITLGLSGVLCAVGYMNIWPLFGSANQLLAALVLMSAAVFMKANGIKYTMLTVPMVFMLTATVTALLITIGNIISRAHEGSFSPMLDGMQLVIAAALLILASVIVYHSARRLADSRQEAD